MNLYKIKNRAQLVLYFSFINNIIYIYIYIYIYFFLIIIYYIIANLRNLIQLIK